MLEKSFSVADIFGDHMVLQRDKPIKIWGKSRVLQTIHCFVNGKEVAYTQTEKGVWAITLPPMEAARNLHIGLSGDNEKEIYLFNHVAVGEVWIAGGQSNMEFLLAWDAEGEQAINGADNPDIRFFDCPKIKFTGQNDEDDLSQYGFWRTCDKANAPFFSAVGFYFANKIYEQYQVPVGIVGCNWGGTTAATWLDEGYLREDEKLAHLIQNYEDGLKQLNMEGYLSDEKKARELLKNPYAKKFMSYIMKHTPGRLLRPIFSIPIKSSNKNLVPVGPRSENRPAGLYHTMVEKIAPYSARGVIWYQGESDDNHADLYARLFSTLIRCWRDTWEDEIPFLFVQLAPYERWLGLTAKNFPVLREQQALVSKTVPGAYMVSIMDAGSRFDIHPKNKRPVGERLALLARGKVYGEDILCQAPEAAHAKLENGHLIIAFNHVGKGLYIKGKKLKNLWLFGDDKEIKPLKVSIGKDNIRIQTEKMQNAKEIEVQLAFGNYAEINLYNSADLAAKPFRMKVRRGFEKILP